MTTDLGWPEWMYRWPGIVDRTEVWDGCFAFELRGFSEKIAWTEDDVAAARAVYPGMQVALSPGRRYLFVGENAEQLVERLRRDADDDLADDEGAG
jgi:hypothetical protein